MSRCFLCSQTRNELNSFVVRSFAGSRANRGSIRGASRARDRSSRFESGQHQIDGGWTVEGMPLSVFDWSVSTTLCPSYGPEGACADQGMLERSHGQNLPTP